MDHKIYQKVVQSKMWVLDKVLKTLTLLNKIPELIKRRLLKNNNDNYVEKITGSENSHIKLISTLPLKINIHKKAPPQTWYGRWIW